MKLNELTKFGSYVILKDDEIYCDYLNKIVKSTHQGFIKMSMIKAVYQIHKPIYRIEPTKIITF